MARSSQNSSSTHAAHSYRIIRCVHNSKNRRSSQNSSSTHASHNHQSSRLVHNSENRRTPYGTEHLHSPVVRRSHRRGCPSLISFQFTGTTNFHTAFAMMDSESFSLSPANGFFVMPTHAARPQYLSTRGYPSQISTVIPAPFADTDGAGRGSSRAGYHQQTQNAGHTYVPGPNIGPAPFLHTDVAGPKYPRDWGYPQPSGRSYHGGFTSGAQMNAVRPGSFSGGYNPGGPGANLTPGVQTPAVGLGHAGSSGVGYNQLTPNATLGFAGKTSQAPFLPEYDTQAAAPPAVGLGLNNGGFTSGAQMNAIRPGSVTHGYNPGDPGASLTPGVQTPAVGLGPAGSSGVGYNQLTPNATLGFAGQTSQAPFLPEYDTQATAPPAVGLGLNNGGFTSGAQMNAVRPGSVTRGYNPGGPGASLPPGVQTPAVELGPAGSSGVGYNQLTPNATLGFAGQTSQAPFLPEYDTQAAAPPPTLDQQLSPPSLATAANNAFAEDFLPPAVSDNFMDMLEPRFWV